MVGFVSCLIFMTGCVRQRKMSVLPHTENNRTVANNVEVITKSLNGKQSKKYFGVNTIKRGFRSIQITITNQTTTDYLLKPENISLPLEIDAKGS